MFLIDSHCHLDKLDYQSTHQNVTDIINNAHARDVKLILSICTTLTNFFAMKKMIGYHNNVVFSCGIHPLNIDKSHNLTELHHLASCKRVVALGETGLDYYHQQDNKLKQQEVFREHIQTGRKLNKPVIVHSRNARKDTLIILNEERAGECGGVLHCFTENRTTAKILLNLGFYISFSGIITFNNTENLREIARYIPLDRLLIETDSPYLAPVPYRGKENQPAYLRDIAEYIATLKNISLQQLATATTTNFSRLFHIEI